MNEWTVLAAAVAFRLLETIVKVVKETGKFNLLAILKEFLRIG